MAKLLLFLLLSGVLHTAQPAAESYLQETGTIIIQLESLDNQNGVILISLYSDEKGFPDEWEKAFRSEIVPVTAELREIRLDDIPHGTYALAIVHDENENMKLDTNIFGVPREGYGFSNNARGRFGPPRFSDTLFTLDSESYLHQIRLIY
ncbi:MAG: DUF2141 domain-containing protein [Balneolaceae bacterium]|nr:DUF2141 domain-containing protein [Balneolaceae bacterium]